MPLNGKRKMLSYQQLQEAWNNIEVRRLSGRVTRSVGLIIESKGPPARIGEICHVYTSASAPPLTAEVVGFRDERLLLMPFAETDEIAAQSEVVATGQAMMVPVGDDMLGRVLDGLGQPLDEQGPITAAAHYPVNAPPPSPLSRQRITEPLPLGIRAIDGLLTCGRGQRLGIFAGSGVGKSTLLGMIARNTAAEVNVIGLVGERGREVREFIERDLGEEGLQRSVVVAATSDRPPLVRLRAAQVATAIAEYFRDKGKDVLLMMDSITRVAWAQRQIGLAAGEPPTRNGYTPSVFAMLPRLLERAGAASTGTITGLYTVLVEGDDMTEPIADAARSTLDGHIVLSRKLAESNHYPAVDVLQSVSRLMVEITSEEHQQAAGQLREAIASYEEAEDLINLGAYSHGSNPRIDRAITLRESILGFLRQGIFTSCPYQETLATLRQAVTLSPPAAETQKAA